jgi:hypothetical protein
MTITGTPANRERIHHGDRHSRCEGPEFIVGITASPAAIVLGYFISLPRASPRR